MDDSLGRIPVQDFGILFAMMSSEIKFSRKQSGDKSDKFKNLRQVAESYTENGSFLTSFRCKTVTTQILRSNISRASQYMTK